MKLAHVLRGSAAILGLSISAAVTASGQILFNNGPAVTSGLSVIRPGGTLLGSGAQSSIPNIVADNFSVTGSAWNVTSFSVFAYQTGATNFTFTGLTWSIVSGDVNTGSVVASGTLAPTNGGLVGYRVSPTTLTATNRPIFQLDADVPDFSLSVGGYWLRWAMAGTVASGPWAPPTSDGVIGDAMQSLANAPFASIVDAGDNQGVALPFIIRGSVDTVVPEPSTWSLMLVGAVGLVGIARRRRLS